MENDELKKLFTNAVRDGVREGVTKKLTGYNSPLDKLVEGAFDSYKGELQGVLEQSIQCCISSAEFKKHVSDAINSNLAKILIQRFGGEVEKQVNALKSDPTTRARITLAIEQIVKDANK